MPRVITSHIVQGLNAQLAVEAADSPGAGNACHQYQIRPVELDTFDVCADPQRAVRLTQAVCDIRFQNGPIAENGVNGISNEALLAVLIDRLEGFQAGEYACRENELALSSLRTALGHLNQRTRERLERGVEGTSQK